MMTIFYWILIVFLLTYEPIYGYFDYQRFKARVRSFPNERVKYYSKVMLGLWIPAIVILSVTAFGPVTLKDIGLSGIAIHTTGLGKWITYISLGLALFYLLSLCYYIIGSKVSEKMQNNIAEIQKKQLETSTFADIMPVSKEDKKFWTYVSWTAGITEEIIYRGFLIYALSQLFPDLSIWFILVISSILFGLSHTYQGFPNVIRTTIFGFFFAVLYIGLGSIIPLILFHFFVDYMAKVGKVSAEKAESFQSINKNL